MREIKFRAWDDRFHMMRGPTVMDTVYGCKKFMQYTGLKDKNGKEIYEGDVVVGPGVKSWLPGSYQSETNSLVSWEGAAWWPFADADDNAPYPRPEDCEVIGNIYDNPELVK